MGAFVPTELTLALPALAPSPQPIGNTANIRRDALNAAAIFHFRRRRKKKLTGTMSASILPLVRNRSHLLNAADAAVDGPVATVTVAKAVAELFNVTDAGLTVHVEYCGAPLQARETEPVELLTGRI